MTCPNCKSEYAYPDVTGYSCPECGHHWTDLDLESTKMKDAVGNILNDGDNVIVIQDLKLGKETIKKGSKAKAIKLIDPIDGHDISAKIDGFGSIYLKSSVVKKI